MPSSKIHPLDSYPAHWIACAREAFSQPGFRVWVVALPGRSRSEAETQQRKLRAFLGAFKRWPGVAPDVSQKLAAGWALKTHRRSEMDCVVFSLSAHPPRGHEIELVKKALAGG